MEPKTLPTSGERHGRWLAHVAPAVLGLVLVAYLVFPGYMIGILIRTGCLDVMHPAKSLVWIFAPVNWLSRNVSFLDSFYEWQVRQIIRDT